jgi:CubicO group peptidase (beta-lactamase class C family)
MRHFLWWLLFMLAAVLWSADGAEAESASAAGVFPASHWGMAAMPDALGWSTVKLAQAEAFAAKIGSAAVMVVDRGVVVVAWGHVAHRYPIHSIRKPLLGALVGIYAAEGRIDISKRLVDLGIDETPPGLTAAEKQATLADLLASRSGVYHPALGEVAAMTQTKPGRGSHLPGTFWYYNNWDFNALGTVFEQETGLGIFDAFAQRIAKPLQMQDFDVRDGKYISGLASIHRVYAFRMSARDLARFGWLYRNRGQWQGRRIVPAAWVAESTATHASLGRGRGYGYMWRTAVGEGLAPNVTLPLPCFYHSGAGLHFLIVIPWLDLVVVHRVDTDAPGPYPRPQQIGRLLWMLLDARGVQGIGPDPSLSRSERHSLAGDELFRVLTQHRFRILIPNGLIEGGDRHYRLTFGTDGVLTMAGELRADVKGHWEIQENQCCVDIDGFKECLTVIDKGEALAFYDTTNTLYKTTIKTAP